MKGRFLLLIFIIISLSACQDTIPVWRAVKELPDFTLYLADYPCELVIDLSNSSNEEFDGKLELVVTYHKNIGRREIPLFITIEDQDNKINEYYTSIPIKEFDQFIGKPDERNEQYTISHIAIPQKRFNKQSYKFKVYADTQSEEKVYGITQIEIRIYRLTSEAS